MKKRRPKNKSNSGSFCPPDREQNRKLLREILDERLSGRSFSRQDVQALKKGKHGLSSREIQELDQHFREGGLGAADFQALADLVNVLKDLKGKGKRK